MPRAKETMRIEIEESTSEETRTITLTIAAPAQEFLLADLLKQRGAMPGIETALKAAARETVQGYLENAEELIAGIKDGQRKGSNGAKPKGGTAGGREGNGSGADAIGEVRQGADDNVLNL